MAELREENASPDAHRRVHLALSRPKPRRSWRLAALAGALALPLVPLLTKSGTGSAYAVDVRRAIDASRAAPYVIDRQYHIDPAGKRTVQFEGLWAPQRRVEKFFFSPKSLREIRHLSGFTFERDVFSSEQGQRPYETLQKTKEPPLGTESQNALGRFDAIRTMYGDSNRLVRLSDEGEMPGGERRVRYRLVAQSAGKRVDFGVWTLAVPSTRILRVEMPDPDGSLDVEEIEYPASIDPNRLGVPPVGWTWPDDFRRLDFPDPGLLPRFDLDRERDEIDRRTAHGLRKATVKGRSVRLVGAFQAITDPRQPLYVMYVAGEPDGDANHPAKASGVAESWGVTTMRSIPPKALATVFATRSPVSRTDVRIPVYGRPGEFLGYASFKDVPVEPFSNGLRSSLRTPPFR